MNEAAEAPGQSAAVPLPNPGWGPLSALPGNPLMWILIASELAVFGVALMGYTGARVRDPAGFAAAQDTLDRLAGTINTAVLLTSGMFAALATAARRRDDRLRGRLCLALAAALGAVFLGVKAVEYTNEIAAGYDMDSGTFFTLYYLITGFHAIHVFVGMLVLGIVAAFDSLENYETGTAFWHMVDLIWIVIFPCIYLLR
jgi:nitric oxide reductase NorE protein